MSRAQQLSVRAGGLSLAADRAVRYLTASTAWALLSLTIIGLPAATAALHAVTKEWAAGDERPVLARFAAGVHRYGWRATALAAVVVPLLILAGLNLWLTPLMAAQQHAVTVAVVAVTLPLTLWAATLPSTLVDTDDTVVEVIKVAAQRMVIRPLNPIAAVVLGVAVAASALLLPLLLLATPAIAVRLHRALTDRSRHHHHHHTGRTIA